MKIILLFAGLFISSGAFAQNKVYKFLDKSVDADLAYKEIKNLDDYGPGYSVLNKVFKPTKGNFTVYRFIATFKGLSGTTNKLATFHDLIILKVSTSELIIDGYQYTLEWTDTPEIDLYRVKAKNIILKNDLPVKTLKFTNVPIPDDKQQEFKLLEDHGTVRFN